ncbi:6635_t:CDS:2 [Paraglomus occultum]|uniref:6635_t:CDS:1 n=1 Tax=Paraglomus occultum TaxID=144539 RepID=A0A9N9BEV2_9GLOM|nr:6635_t:CDS:2 [Paraglomus occultum]
MFTLQETIQANIISTDNQIRTLNNALHKTHEEQEALLSQNTIELRALTNVYDRRSKLVRERDPDMYTAAQWVQQNKAQFKCPVFLPVYMEIIIKEDRHIDLVEAVAGEELLKTFTCQTVEDYNLFMREVIDAQNLRVNVVWCGSQTLGEYRSLRPVQELRRYGVEGYLLDQVEGPEPVLTVLCAQADFHAVAYVPEEIDHQLIVESVRSFGSFTYICGDTIYNVRFSTYGQRLPLVTTCRWNRAVFLTDLEDIQKTREIWTKLRSFRERIEHLSQILENLMAETTVLSADRAALQTQERQLVTMHKEYEDAIVKFRE